MRVVFSFIGLLLLSAGGIGCADKQYQTEVNVYAAASLTEVVAAIADSFQVDYPDAKIWVNWGASSILARQIEAGAPADIYISANIQWADYLKSRALLFNETHDDFSNRLTFVSGEEGKQELHQARITSIALADPSHVPAGQYAVESLKCLGIWDELQPRVIPTLDVRAALASVQTGATDAAIVYASDIEGTGIRANLISKECQPTIRYSSGLIDANNEDARRFLNYVRSARFYPVWEKFGFEIVRKSGAFSDAR